MTRGRRPAERSVLAPTWPGTRHTSTPWGRCVKAFEDIIDHVNVQPGASVLLANSTAAGYVNLHKACEYYLPQAGAERIAGVWFFANKSRVRIARISDMEDIAKISNRQFSLIAVHADAEVIAMLRPLLLMEGKIIPFHGMR